MKRRHFFAVMGAGAAAASLPLSVLAAEGDKSIEIAGSIGRNHGHAVELNMVQVIELLRETKDGETTLLDIQGRSGHPHTFELDHESLIELLAVGVIQGESSFDAGHTHSVEIKLDISVEEALTDVLPSN
ncbi:MAG: hypothetical protein AAF203_09775 [Pseudomonadota bacterium]